MGIKGSCWTELTMIMRGKAGKIVFPGVEDTKSTTRKVEKKRKCKSHCVKIVVPPMPRYYNVQVLVPKKLLITHYLPTLLDPALQVLSCIG
jgi:transposase